MMRKLVSGFAASLDGFIEGPNGEYDWILINEEMDFAEQMKRYDTFLYGRKTYEAVLKMGAGKLTDAKHYVFSRTLNAVAPGFVLIKNEVGERVLQIKQEPGNDIALFGGASLLATMLDFNLVDEISIAVIPVLLSRGKHMVDILNNRVWLSLQKTYSYSNGTVQLTYTVNNKGKKVFRES